MWIELEQGSEAQETWGVWGQLTVIKMFLNQKSCIFKTITTDDEDPVQLSSSLRCLSVTEWVPVWNSWLSCSS